MSNPDLVEIVAIVDNSGSMDSIAGAAIAGFNALLRDQQTLMNAADAIFSLVLFNSRHACVYDAVDIGEVKPLTEKTYQCDGGTALWDAIGETIQKVHKRISAIKDDEDVPGTVLFVVITDGGENESRHFRSSDQVRDLIQKRMNEDNWKFNYLSSDCNGERHAHDIGIPSENVLQLRTGGEAMKEGYIKISTAYSQYRTGAKKQTSFK